jgi:uncharacterized protein
MSEKKRILYVQTSGVDTPERLYAPLILAQTARAMDLEASIFFLGLGLKVLVKGEAEKVKIGAFPSIADLLKQAAGQGVQIIACRQSMELFGGTISDGDLLEEATVAGAATLNDLALDADVVLTF